MNTLRRLRNHRHLEPCSFLAVLLIYDFFSLLFHVLAQQSRSRFQAYLISMLLFLFHLKLTRILLYIGLVDSNK